SPALSRCPPKSLAAGPRACHAPPPRTATVPVPPNVPPVQVSRVTSKVPVPVAVPPKTDRLPTPSGVAPKSAVPESMTAASRTDGTPFGLQLPGSYQSVEAAPVQWNVPGAV